MEASPIAIMLLVWLGAALLLVGVSSAVAYCLDSLALFVDWLSDKIDEIEEREDDE